MNSVVRGRYVCFCVFVWHRVDIARQHTMITCLQTHKWIRYIYGIASERGMVDMESKELVKSNYLGVLISTVGSWTQTKNIVCYSTELIRLISEVFFFGWFDEGFNELSACDNNVVIHCCGWPNKTTQAVIFQSASECIYFCNFLYKCIWKRVIGNR